MKLLLPLMLLGSPLASAADDAPKPPSPPAASELPAGVYTWQVDRDEAGVPGTISLDLVDADIRSVLRLFGEVGGLNFVMTDEVKGSITAQLKDVSWEDALATILLAKGLAASPVGGQGSILMVQPFGSR